MAYGAAVGHRAMPRWVRPAWPIDPAGRIAARLGHRRRCVRGDHGVCGGGVGSPAAIASLLSMPASTVHAVLVRCRLNRLSHIDIRTGQAIRRFQYGPAGAMLHVDIKKLGKIPAGGGWRFLGRAPCGNAIAPGPSKAPDAIAGTNRSSRLLLSCIPPSTGTPARLQRAPRRRNH